MIKRISIYIFIFLLSLMIFLLATLPAGLLWERIVMPQVPVQQFGVKVLGVDGTVWRGRAHISYKKIEGIVNWDLSLLGLVAAELPLEFSMNSHLGALEGQVIVSSGSARLILPKAEIELAPINPLLRRDRVTLDGIAQLNGIEIVLEDNRIVFAEGKGSWSGGDIAYPVGRKVHERNLPAFFAQLATTEEGLIELGIKDAEARFNVIEATLNQEGEALLSVKRRLLDLAGETARHNNETDVVFKVKKPLRL